MFDFIYDFYYMPLWRQCIGEGGGGHAKCKEHLVQRFSSSSNGHFSMHDPKPNLPDVVDVGGIHSRMQASSKSWRTLYKMEESMDSSTSASD